MSDIRTELLALADRLHRIHHITEVADVARELRLLASALPPFTAYPPKP